MKQALLHVIVAKACLHWYSHLIHSPKEHLTLHHLKLELAGTGWKRPTGEPHVRWIDIIHGDIAKLSLQPQQAR